MVTPPRAFNDFNVTPAIKPLRRPKERYSIDVGHQQTRYLEVLAFLAEGVRISTLSRVKGYKEDTILDWLREAAQHVAEIEAVLLANYRLERGQLDAMWSYVGNKGEKTITPKPKRAVNFGGQQ